MIILYVHLSLLNQGKCYSYDNSAKIWVINLYKITKQAIILLSKITNGTPIKRYFSLIALFPIDDWEIPFEAIQDLQWLGSGAQGAVFMGKYQGEQVAVKKVKEEYETDIKHLRKLNHPNIVLFK